MQTSYELTTQELDILIAISKKKFFSQRELSSYTGHALGMVNKALHTLQQRGFVLISEDSFGNNEIILAREAQSLIQVNSPHNAIILAAGFGMRMVPINLETPKALLTVKGERLIERQIKQLNAVGIVGSDIHIIVGFMKEKFEYLMDKYGVDLIVNADYASKNNLQSLFLASNYLNNSYIIPSDVWCDKNPFSAQELYSWYMVSDEPDNDSDVKVNRKNELVRVGKGTGNSMVGIAYLCGKNAEIVKKRLREFSKEDEYRDAFWEETLYGRSEDSEPTDRMILQARIVHSADVAEINTYEQLRDLDNESSELQSEAMDTISSVFGCDKSEITDIAVLKKGMTNRSFLFEVPVSGIEQAGTAKEKFIMRIPGEGTDQLIDRAHEADVYKAISGKGLCDDPVYINPKNGYKITKFLNGIRNCDPKSEDDLIRCMRKLKEFHEMKIQVGHKFGIFGQIKFYQSLWNGTGSMYEDHKQTTENVFKLKRFIDGQKKICCLTHIDAVPDNFLFYKLPGDKEEKLQLTDWEYAGMQDPHVDIAMFCIYSLYNKEQVDHLIDLYFEGEKNCTKDTRTKIYCYIAACGLLWSNWCEYKAHLGVEFGEYSLRQYRYAKDYYRYAIERM